MTIFIRFAMAESVVDIDGNGSFQNQTEDVASSVTILPTLQVTIDYPQGHHDYQMTSYTCNHPQRV